MLALPRIPTATLPNPLTTPTPIIGRSVQVPALTTLIAVLVGGALLGLVGALMAIPVATAN
ncbi:hypothetical protein [Nocardia speluncae]|uniref:hypothetical protein n=1 Tax=Nocardia speluncae TaxID=419477 RepID=UPI00082A163C|nr:hypothetical protein [Nocardia speluncae]